MSILDGMSELEQWILPEDGKQVEKHIEVLTTALDRAESLNKSYGNDVLDLEIKIKKLKKEVAALRDFIDDIGMSTDRLDNRLKIEGVL